MSLRVEQCLHGYGDGHERLASSVTLPDAEAYRLDRMSDLSGYPGKHDPPPYLTGYPCGRWYVVARTWIDREAERRGTVFTHSILVPLADIGAIEDLASFVPLFRQPTHPVDTRGWESPLALTPRRAPPRVDPVAAAAWFEAETPLVWTGEGAEDAARSVWASLPAAARADFRFCTHALLPRYLDERPFDWIAAPRHQLLEYGSARQHLRERDRGSDIPAWLIAVPWPPAWQAIEATLPGLRRGDRRAALRFMALRAQAGREALLGAADLLDRLRLSPGSPTATMLFGALLDSAPDPDLPGLQDLLSREPLRWAPNLEDALCGYVHDAVARLGASLDDAQLDRVLAWEGAPGRSAREALRRCAAEWPDARILARLERHPELFGDWVYRLPSSRRRGLVQAASGAARAVLVGDVQALESLVEPGDPAWVEVAVAAVGADERGLRRVLRRVGPEAVSEWARGGRELPRVVLDLLAEGDALSAVLRGGDAALLDAVLSRASDEDLRDRLTFDPSAAGAAWRTLAERREPAMGRSRIARALLDVGATASLFGLLSDEAKPLATVRERDVGALVGVILRSALGSPPDAGAAALLQHPEVAQSVPRLARRDVDWLLGEADVALTVAWVTRDATLAAREPHLVFDLVQAWSRRGWPPDATDGMSRVIDALPDERRLLAAGLVLDACLRHPRDADALLVTRCFPLVHGAILADKHIFHEIRDWLTDHWDKAKRPRHALLRAWEQRGWPPRLLDDAFPTPDEWKHLVRDLSELSPAARGRYVRWLQHERPTRFFELPGSLQVFAKERG